MVQPYNTCPDLTCLCIYLQHGLTNPYTGQPYITCSGLTHLYIVRPYTTSTSLSHLCISSYCSLPTPTLLNHSTFMSACHIFAVVHSGPTRTTVFDYYNNCTGLLQLCLSASHGLTQAYIVLGYNTSLACLICALLPTAAQPTLTIFGCPSFACPGRHRLDLPLQAFVHVR